MWIFDKILITSAKQQCEKTNRCIKTLVIITSRYLHVKWLNGEFSKHGIDVRVRHF